MNPHPIPIKTPGTGPRSETTALRSPETFVSFPETAAPKNGMKKTLRSLYPKYFIPTQWPASWINKTATRTVTEIHVALMRPAA